MPTDRPPSCPCCGHTFGSKDVSYTGPHGGRLPLLLQCGHSVCEGCLTKLSHKQANMVTCPVCQIPMSLKSDGIKGLPVDCFAVGLVTLCRKSTVERIKTSTVQFQMDGTNSGSARRKEKAAKKEMCMECGTSAATCCCHKCESVMCGNCFDKVHKASKSLRKHQAAALSENDVSSMFPSTCDTHSGRRIEYFCEDDHSPICSHCVIMGDHKGHAISTMEDKNKKALIELGPALETCRTVLKRMRKSEKELATSSPGSRGCQQVAEDISLHFRQIHGLLQARETALLEELNQKYEAKNSLEEMRSSLLSNIWSLDQSIKEAHHVLKATNQNVFNAQSLLTKLKQSTSLPSVAMKISPEDVVETPLVCTFKEDLTQEVNSYGHLHGYQHVGYALRSLEEVPVEMVITDDEPSIFDAPLPSSTSDTVSVTTDTGTLDTDDALSQSSDTSRSSRASKGSSKAKYLKSAKIRMKPLSVESVYVTHIKTPSCFMIQRFRDYERLTTLQRKIAKFCNSTESSKEIPTEVEIGDYFLSSFKKTWYRARITGIVEPDEDTDDPKAEVYYVDYGNSDIVPFRDLRNIKPSFMKIPELAKTCALKDLTPTDPSGDWSQDAVHTFARMTRDKPLQMTLLMEDDDLNHVQLAIPGAETIEDDPPVSFRDALIFMGLASLTTTLPEPPTPGAGYGKAVKAFFLPNLPYKGASVLGVGSFVDSPDRIYLQVGDEAEYLHKMMVDMQSTYNQDPEHIGDTYTVFCPQKDMSCVCQYSGDKAWYRAQVLELVGNRLVRVKYVDYGNQEIVSHWKLRKILNNYMILPMQAVPCRLVDVEPLNKEEGWSQEVKNELSSQICFKRMSVLVKDITDDRVLEVVMTESLEVTENNATEPTSFNQWLVASGLAKSTGPRRHKQRKKKFSRSPSKLPVTIAKPASLPVTVAKHRPPTSPQPQPVLPDMRSSAFLTPDNTPVAPPTKEPTPPKQADQSGAEKPPYQEVKVSHIVSAGEIYMFLVSSEDERDRLMLELNAALNQTCEPPDGTTWKVEDSCAAKYSEDDRWYRAKILRLMDNEHVEVSLLDFGFLETLPLSGLRVLPDQFKNQHQFSFRCHLEDLQPAGDVTRWSRTSTEYLAEILKNKICYIVTQGEVQAGSVAVDLLLEEIIEGDALSGNQVNYKSVGKMLLDKGLALPKRFQKKSASRGAIRIPGMTPTSTRGETMATRPLTPSGPVSVKTAAVDSKTAAVDSKTPAADSKTPPVDSKIPAADSKMATADSKIAAADSKMTAADSKMVTQNGVTAEKLDESNVEIKACVKEESDNQDKETTSSKSEVVQKQTAHCEDLEGQSSEVTEVTEAVNTTTVHKDLTQHEATRTVLEPHVTDTTTNNEEVKVKEAQVKVEEVKVTATRDTEHNDSESEEQQACESKTNSSPETVQSDTDPETEADQDVTLTLRIDDNQPVADPDAPLTPPPLVRPSDHPAPPPPCPLMHYKPAEIPTSTLLTVVPTYVDYDCHIFVQEVKPDDHPEGRLGYVLKENTIEVILQNSYFQKMGLQRAKIIRDGNCLFRAIAQSLFGDQDIYRQVRQTVVETFLEYWWLFEGIIVEKDKDDYIAKMSNDGTYGGELEIQAICFCYQIQVKLYMGGLMSAILVRSYGNSSHTPVSLSYVADGSYDAGHYDLVVDCDEEAASAEAIYSEWRVEKVAQFQMSQRQFNNNNYEQSLLEQLMSYLQKKFKDSRPDPMATWSVGKAVVVQYTDDNNFYRAEILDITKEGYKVKYIDFGNFQIVPPSLLREEVAHPDIPAQCYECLLDHIQPVNKQKWEVSSLNNIHELVVGKTLLLHIRDILSGPLLVVDLETTDGGCSISERLCQYDYASRTSGDDLHPGSHQDVPRSSSPLFDIPTDVDAALDDMMIETVEAPTDYMALCGIPQRQVPSPYSYQKTPQRGDVFLTNVTQVDYPNLVYLQHQKQEDADEQQLVAINDQLDQLLEVSTILNMRAPHLPQLTDVKPGVACVARYSLDECWYRAEVVSTGHAPGDYCGVLFVDYGSSEYLPSTSLLELPEEMLCLPTQAFKCVLSGLEPPVIGDPTSWDPIITVKMTELLAMQSLIAIVKNTELELEVDLYPQDQFLAIGRDAALAYAPLVDQGFIRAVPDVYGSPVDNPSWADQAEREIGDVE